MAEPYVFNKVSALTGEPSIIQHKEGINLENTLSLHIRNYVNTQLNNEDDEEVVAEEEPNEAGTSSGGDCDELLSAKTKKEKNIKEVDLLEPLAQMQQHMSVKISKKQGGRKLKARAMKEWQRDFMRAADADQMDFITHALSKLRQEDKVGLRKTNRSCNGGGHYPYGAPQPTQQNFRPPSSNYTSSSAMPVQIRSRF